MRFPDGEPIIVCLQAGNLHSGAFDPFEEAITMAHERGAWVHIDGAFGLWAGASPSLRPLVRGFEAADSWATDAHKTLNVPYDCGIAIVAEPSALRSALGAHADYLISDRNPGPGDPLEKVPEFSRRARGVPTWAAIRSLGRQGVVKLVENMVEMARMLAREIELIDGAEVLNDVVYTQVCVSFGDDERTRCGDRPHHSLGNHVDVGIPLARAQCPPHLGEQLVDQLRRMFTRLSRRCVKRCSDDRGRSTMAVSTHQDGVQVDGRPQRGAVPLEWRVIVALRSVHWPGSRRQKSRRSGQGRRLYVEDRA